MRYRIELARLVSMPAALTLCLLAASRPAWGWELLVGELGSSSVLRFEGPSGASVDSIVSSGSGGLNMATGVEVGTDGHLYISSEGTGQVLRYDGITGSFLGVFVSPGNKVFDAKFGPDGKLYVLWDPGSSGIKRYNGSTGAFIDDFVPLGSGGLSDARGIEFGSDGRVYVADATQGVARYDGTTGAFLGLFASLYGAHSLVFGADGDLYVASYYQNKVARFDGGTGAYIDDFVPAGSGGLSKPVDLDFGPDGNLYVSSSPTDQILRYNGMTGAFIDAFATGPRAGSLNASWFFFRTGPGIQLGDRVLNPANGHGYGLTPARSWPDAEIYSQERGAHLVALSSQEEQDWVRATFGTSTTFWLGFTDAAQEGVWVWTTKEPATFLNWDAGEPGNFAGREHVAILNYVPSGKWHDTWAEYTFQGILERPPSAPERSWTATYSDASSGEDIAQAVEVAPDGDVVVTGWSYGGPSTGLDLTTIRYAADGTRRWLRTYNGPGNGADRGWAVAVDSAGNAYVGGSRSGSGTGDDLVVIKYSPSGDTLWTFIFDGPAHANDTAFNVAVDSSGNAYATGWSEGTGGVLDAVTFKIGPTGSQVWYDRYDGPASGNDQLYDVAVDGPGNVYVTGYTATGASSWDYLTIKYTPGGTRAWTRLLNGSANGQDSAQRVAVDASGNVYVTGWASNSGTGYDAVTLSYDAAGNQRWVQTYNGSGNDSGYNMALDPAGSVYVSGYSVVGGNPDFATVKYDAATGSQLWVRRYDNPKGTGDNPYDMGIDSTGNVYVSGVSDGSWATVKYDASGNEKWVFREAGTWNGSGQVSHCLAVSPSGDVHVTGAVQGSGTGWDMVTVKYEEPRVRISVAAAEPQPAGCAANRWMPFWVEVKGSCVLSDPAEKVAGYELWLSFDAAKVAFDLEGNGSWDDLSFEGTACQWTVGGSPEGPDEAYAHVEESSGQSFVRLGVVFETNQADLVEKALDSFGDEVPLVRIRFHAKDYPSRSNPAVNTVDFRLRPEIATPYFVKHKAGQVPEEVDVESTSDLVGLVIASGNLFVRGNATGNWSVDPVAAPPADPRLAIDLSDGVWILWHLFVSAVAYPLPCREASDANDDGRVNMLDAVHVLQWLFGTASDFPPPLEHLGVDDDGDATDCATSQI